MSVAADFSQQGKKKATSPNMWWRHLLAGGVAGAVSRTCTAPLDRLKDFLQVHGSKSNRIRSSLKYMFQDGGFCGFWNGNGINVLKIVPESAIKFMVYEECKSLIRGNSTRELSIYERFVAGSLAGAVSQTAIYPLEVLKTRLALRKTGQYKGIVDAAQKIYKKEAFKSFYREYIPNLLGIIPYAGINLATYETLKNSYIRKHNGDTPNNICLMAFGAVSCTFGQLCSYLLSLVRTRLQAQVRTAQHGDSHAQNSEMCGVIRTIVEKEGLFGLYRGMTPCFLKVIPAVCISYVVYERMKLSLDINIM